MSKQKNNFKNFHRRSTNYVLWSVVSSKLFLEWKRTEGFSSTIDFEIVVKLVQMSIYITRRTDCKFEVINALLQLILFQRYFNQLSILRSSVVLIIRLTHEETKKHFA